MHIKTIRKEGKNKTYFQNPFVGDDNIENNFVKNYFPNITNQYLYENQKKIIKHLLKKKKKKEK